MEQEKKRRERLVKQREVEKFTAEEKKNVFDYFF